MLPDPVAVATPMAELGYQPPSGLSPSSMARFEQCELGFYFDSVARIPTFAGEPAVTGTFVHAVLEQLLALPVGQRTRDEARRIAGQLRAEFCESDEFVALGYDEDQAREWAWKAWASIEAYFRLEDPNNVEVVALEQRHDLELDGTPVRGITDRVEHIGGAVCVSDYKGLALTTALPTPSGWTTMGEVQPGDLLMGSDGNPTRVVEKSQVHHRRCYRITFDDGSDIVCDNEHLWQVLLGRHHQEKVLNTDELFEHRRSGDIVLIPNAAPLLLPSADLPIDPYVLGVWLGDGSSSKGIIYAGEEDKDEIARLLTDRGEVVVDLTSPSSARRSVAELWLASPHPEQCHFGHNARYPNRPDGRQGDCRECVARREPAFPINGTLHVRIKAAGLVNSTPRTDHHKRRTNRTPNKHIPAAYLRGSTQQRIDLLRGLMDTDGSWNSTRRQAVFVTTNENLACGVQELVVSLGGRCYSYRESYETSTRAGIKWMVMFRPPGFNPFSLQRKADACAPHVEASSRSWRRSVRAVEPVESVPTQCVKVDAPNSLYLAGRQMVPTHNTGKTPKPGFATSKFGQIAFYAAMIRATTGVLPTKGRLFFIGADEPTIVQTRISEELVAKIIAQVGDVWERVGEATATATFTATPNKLCDWCDHKAYCPAWGGNLDDAPVVIPADASDEDAAVSAGSV